MTKLEKLLAQEEGQYRNTRGQYFDIDKALEVCYKRLLKKWRYKDLMHEQLGDRIECWKEARQLQECYFYAIFEALYPDQIKRYPFDRVDDIEEKMEQRRKLRSNQTKKG